MTTLDKGNYISTLDSLDILQQIPTNSSGHWGGTKNFLLEAEIYLRSNATEINSTTIFEDETNGVGNSRGKFSSQYYVAANTRLSDYYGVSPKLNDLSLDIEYYDEKTNSEINGMPAIMLSENKLPNRIILKFDNQRDLDPLMNRWRLSIEYARHLTAQGYTNVIDTPILAKVYAKRREGNPLTIPVIAIYNNKVVMNTEPIFGKQLIKSETVNSIKRIIKRKRT